jgi:hypothetical protein
MTATVCLTFEQLGPYVPGGHCRVEKTDRQENRQADRQTCQGTSVLKKARIKINAALAASLLNRLRD